MTNKLGVTPGEPTPLLQRKTWVPAAVLATSLALGCGTSDVVSAQPPADASSEGAQPPADASSEPPTFVDPASSSGALPFVTDGSPAGLGSWALTFSDEFTGTTITSRWNTSFEKDRGINHNGTPYDWWHRSSNLSLDGSGHLDIKFIREADGGGIAMFSSGLLNTNGTNPFSQLYGYYEAKIQLPPTNGTQGAMWMMPQAGIANCSTAPMGGAEYDILESNRQADSYSTNIHQGGYEACHTSLQGYINASGMHNGYHTWGFDWAADHVSFYYDGVRYRTVLDTAWISHVAQYPILSGGILRPFDGGDIFSALLPYHMFVDYARVWKR